jgi:hypothetical protein
LRGFFKSKPLRVVGVVVLLAVVVAVLFRLLNWYVAPTKPSEREDLILTLAQILAGTALLAGLYFTWRTLQVNREGQITDRFTRAIDQLGKTDDKGNKLFEIRLGGIYALERIAVEAPEEYHWPIMEVLTAYVRQHAPSRPEEGQQGEEDAAVEKSEEDSGRSRGESEPAEVPAPALDIHGLIQGIIQGIVPAPPAPDIQAIMTVIRRRTRYYGNGEPESLALYQTNLSRANLSGAKLQQANLQQANLSFAHLPGADLSGAFLSGAKLRFANLSEANLSGAHLSRADLSEAVNLTQEQLEATKSGDQYTRLPSRLKPPAHWGVKTDEQIEGD